MLFTRIRAWWRNRKLARIARRHPGFAEGGYTGRGDANYIARPCGLANARNYPGTPPGIYPATVMVDAGSGNDSGIPFVTMPIREFNAFIDDGNTLNDCARRLTNHVDAHTIVGSNILDTHCHAPSSDYGGSDGGSSGCDSSSSSDSGGCSGGD